MTVRILSAQEFYTGVADYMHRVDPSWDEERWQAQMVEESEILSRALGEGKGHSVLDCSCGSGGQAIPLAELGWQVTATDITEAYLNTARNRLAQISPGSRLPKSQANSVRTTSEVRQEAVEIDFRTCDMRDLGRHFRATFDWVVSCMALDNITADEGIEQAVRGMYEALKPGGRCYIRLRDFDNIMRVRPRYDFKEERRVPYGRVIRLEDWDYESETYVVCIYVFLREDSRIEGYRWVTDVFAYRRRALRKAELEQFLRVAGFRQVEFLPQPGPWRPYEVVASKGGREWKHLS